MPLINLQTIAVELCSKILGLRLVPIWVFEIMRLQKLDFFTRKSFLPSQTASCAIFRAALKTLSFWDHTNIFRRFSCIHRGRKMLIIFLLTTCHVHVSFHGCHCCVALHQLWWHSDRHYHAQAVLSYRLESEISFLLFSRKEFTRKKCWWASIRGSLY